MGGYLDCEYCGCRYDYNEPVHDIKTCADNLKEGFSELEDEIERLEEERDFYIGASINPNEIKKLRTIQTQLTHADKVIRYGDDVIEAADNIVNMSNPHSVSIYKEMKKRYDNLISGLSSGRTTGFDPVNRGSTPSPDAKLVIKRNQSREGL